MASHDIENRMYLIHCKKDNSFTICSNSALLADVESVNEGDKVWFRLNNEDNLGKIICISDDRRELVKERAVWMKKAAPPVAPKPESPMFPKRKSVQPTRYSSDGDSSVKNAKKARYSSDDAESTSKNQIEESTAVKKINVFYTGKTKRQDEAGKRDKISSKTEKKADNSLDDTSLSDTAIHGNLDPEEIKTSSHGKIKPKGNSSSANNRRDQPLSDQRAASNGNSDTEDTLIPIHEKIKGKEKSSPSKNTRYHVQPSPVQSDNEENHQDNNNDAIDSDDEDKSQLFGPQYDNGKMKKLADGIYCRMKVYDAAVGASHLASHVARKLIDGMYKREILERATFSGRAPRAQGPERQKMEMIRLHRGAKDAIINYAMKYAQDRGWPRQTKEKIQGSMVQKLVDLKREIRDNAAKKNKGQPKE